MSSDDGYILRKNEQGKFVLQHYFASADALPPIDSKRAHIYDTLEEAMKGYQGLMDDYIFTEYGLTVMINDIIPNSQERVKMQIETFHRKSFPIQAVRVSAENINEVAEWCGGSLQTAPADPTRNKEAAPYIKVDAHNPAVARQTRAFVGDWVTCRGTAFKVYTNRAFRDSYGNDQPTIKHNVFEDGGIPSAEASAGSTS